jgi:hypothetical protein
VEQESWDLDQYGFNKFTKAFVRFILNKVLRWKSEEKRLDVALALSVLVVSSPMAVGDDEFPMLVEEDKDEYFSVLCDF